MGTSKCKKKKLTASYAGALLYYAQKAREEGDTRRKEARAYFCSMCKAWHLTSDEDEEKYAEQNKIFIRIKNE